MKHLTPVDPRTPQVHKSPLAKLSERLTKSVTQLEADELQEDAARLGCTPMCDLQDRQEATVSGTVLSLIHI